MKYVLYVAAGALALGACNKSPKIDAKNATPAEVAQKVRDTGADQSMVRPGLWQSKVTIEKFDMPGMPPEMAQRMKAMMAENQGHDFETCLTPEDVQKPKEDFFAGKNKECRYDHFTMGGGKIDAVMHCGKEAGAQTMRMAGTYSPDAYQMQMGTKVDAGGEGAQAMQMQMRVEARRVGECSAKQG
jgi:hypothetical protein